MLDELHHIYEENVVEHHEVIDRIRNCQHKIDRLFKQNT